jgi:hypothetical protein
MSTGPSQFEFGPDHNILFGSLAYKMRWVGLFFAVVGAANLILAILLVATVLTHPVPADRLQQFPTEVQEQLRQLPPKNQLWAMAIGMGLSGVIYLMIGVWTRQAAAAFRRIVDTRGRDVQELMQGLSALHKMYSLLYTLLVVALILFLVSLAASLWMSAS